MGPPRTNDQPVNDLYVIHNVTRGLTLATHVALAGTSEARRRGLLDAESLEAGIGLWIVPCEAIHTFDMKVRLDVVFLDKNLQVRKISSDLGPWRMSVCLQAHSVLELPAGAVARSGTQHGDQLRKEPRASASGKENAPSCR
jgi:uncharacterized membrane protein (UPF0127 family)